MSVDVVSYLSWASEGASQQRLDSPEGGTVRGKIPGLSITPNQSRPARRYFANASSVEKWFHNRRQAQAASFTVTLLSLGTIAA